MLKEIKYIAITILEKIWKFILSSLDGTFTLKNVNMIILIVAILHFIMNKRTTAFILIGAYLSVAVYIIFLEGEWKHKMREDYK